MRRITLVCACLFLFGAFSFGAVASSAGATPDVRPDADWLLAVQTSEGIITQGIDKTWCVPYFANIGARGLAWAYAATRNAAYPAAAWRWLSWYQSKMDAKGFVTDYRLVNGKWTSTGTMDSTDSYAATFLSAVRDVYTMTGDTTKLQSLRTGILKAASAIEATTHTDGLTWAKPDYKMKYLMDNAEVYEGWVAAADLGTALGDATFRSRAQSRATAIANRFPTYRNATAGGYDWAIGETGIHEPLRWSQFYPSASAQPWPVVARLVSGSDARAVMERLDTEQPSWDRPDSRSIINDHEDVIGYWPTIARGFFAAGLTDRAQRAYDTIEAYAGSQSRYWPFHPGTAGELIRLATELVPPPPPPPPPTPTASPTPTSSPSPSPTPTISSGNGSGLLVKNALCMVRGSNCA